MGRIQLESVNSYNNATFLFKTDVVDGSHSPVLNTTQLLNWGSSGSWVNLGTVKLGSWLTMPGIVWYNTTGLVHFKEGLYAFEVDEYDSASGEDNGVPQDHVQCYGNGVYGGDWSEWYMRLENSTLLYNSGLVGHATGKISGDTPDSWTEGSIVYSTMTTNKNGDLALSTDGNVLWESPQGSSYSKSGVFRLNSAVYCPTVTNWNASGVFWYGDNLYSLTLHEQSLKSGEVNFITYFEGGYGAESDTQA